MKKIRKGIYVSEFHEIDYIDGNRVYLKAALATPVNNKFVVGHVNKFENIGFEDLHIDCNLQETYSHLVQKGRNGIRLKHAAHSFIRRCRFTNAVAGFQFHTVYACSAISIIMDGNSGHYPGVFTWATYCLMGLIEDHTDGGMHHGVSVTSVSAGTVFWGIGGPNMRGPDTHGEMPRYTLFDNYYATSHHASGGAPGNLPHHLDGYMRWNNVVDSSSGLNMWNPGGYSFAVTHSSFVGYQTSGSARPSPAYIEGFGSRMLPNSLYLAQLNRRLGFTPAWVNKVKNEHVIFFNDCLGEHPNKPPTFTYLSDGFDIYLSDDVESGTTISDPIHITDYDNSNFVTFSLGGTDKTSFRINEQTGVISTKVSFDHDVKDAYSIDVIATDPHGASNEMTVTIHIRSSNTAPVFSYGAKYITFIHEHAPIGREFTHGKLSATDAEDDHLTYSVRGTDVASFRIDEITGQLHTLHELDYETKSQYNIVGVVSDGALEDTIPVVINVRDGNDSPSISDATFTIEDNVSIGTNVGSPLRASDPNDDVLTYGITSYQEFFNIGHFSIDTETGQITTNSILDGGTESAYYLTITVSDGSLEDSAVITINVDGNDAPKIILPKYTRELTFGIDETNVIGKLIGDPIVATDDRDDTLTYSISGNDVASFEIDSETGQLKTKLAMRYTRRSEATLSIRVRVTDSDGLSDTVAVNVIIEDQDEPYFFDSSYHPRSVVSGTEAGVTIGEPIAAYANGNTNDTDGITYTLSGDAADSFDIDSETGHLITKAALDYDTKNVYSVIVTASDGDLESSITVTITVITYPLLGRTPQVIDAIVGTIQFVDSEVASMTDVTTEHLLTITALNLQDKDIETLKSGDFAGVTSLIKLYLDENSLETLPSDIFSGLSSLQVLRLQLNTIEDLPSGVFDGLSSLKELYLQSNQLDRLPEDVFTGLTALTHLGLNDNGFKRLDSELFDGLTSLAYLFLSDNLLKSLDSELFDGLTSLNTLTLANNNLKKLPDNVFKGLSLHSLRLQRNTVDPIPLDAALEKVDQDQFKLVMRTAAPTVITFPLTVANGSISGGRTSIAIQAGKNESNPLIVTRNVNVHDAVTVAFGTLPTLGWRYSGYEFSTPDDPLVVLGAIVRAPTQRGKPAETALLANYPNPFNPETWIPYQLARRSSVTITIYNVRGTVIRSLQLGSQRAGYYLKSSRAAYWDGRNMYGERVSGGIYFYQFKTDRMSTLRKMVIIK